MHTARERGAGSAASYEKHVLNEINRIARGDVSLSSPLADSVPVPFRKALRRLSATVQSYRSAAESERERDRLTGLLRGAAFRQQVSAQIAQPPSDTSMGILLILDLEGLNRINETLGRHAGDRALSLAAGRLTSGLGHSAPAEGAMPPVIGRLGGDKFGIFVSGASLAWARRCAQMLRVALNEPFFFAASSVIIGGSIGIAAWPDHGDTYDTVFQNADTALREAKAAGRNLCVIFDEDIRQRAQTTAATESMLSEGLNFNQFELYFQPQLRISHDDTPAAEALIRWNHPERGLVMPQDFLPLAERAGLMSDIGRWVLTTAIDAIARLERAGTPCRIAVNLSASELVRRDLIEHVRERLRRTGASPSLLEVEVTESVMMISEAISCEQLTLLRDEGVSIAIDDFGTGYSNLSRLARMPIDRLKIDRSLTNGVLENASEREIVACIVRLGKVLGHEVLVEGIESHDQARALIDMGCDTLQGFHVSRPLRESELITWLPRHRSFASAWKR